jgi:hypothetical protein
VVYDLGFRYAQPDGDKRNVVKNAVEVETPSIAQAAEMAIDI